MKIKLFTTIILGLFFTANYSFAENIDAFNTNYVAASGKVGKIQLPPRADISDSKPCDNGTMYVSKRTGKLNFCRNGKWTTFDSVWEQADNYLYPGNTVEDEDIKVGIGTIHPDYKLHVVSNHSGKKDHVFFFNAIKGALRVGKNSDKWSNGNTGLYSFASGYKTMASGKNSFAIGFGSQAKGDDSIAFGKSNVVTGNKSFALGENATVKGDESIVFNLDGQAETFDKDHVFQINGQVIVGSVPPASSFNFDRTLQIYGESAAVLDFDLVTDFDLEDTSGSQMDTYMVAIGEDAFTIPGDDSAIAEGLYVVANERVFERGAYSNGALMSLTDEGNVGFMRSYPDALVHFGVAMDGNSAVQIKSLAGEGVAFVCINANGELVRSATTCVQ